MKTRMFSNRRARILIGFAPVVLFCFAACSGDFKASRKAGKKIKELTVSPPSFDLNAKALSPNGCLDLSMLQEKLATIPKGGEIREFTTEVAMDQKSVDGKALKNLRNMTVITSFGNFDFQEAPGADFIAALPRVEQDSCKSVRLTDAIGGVESFEVQAPSAPNELHLARYEIKTVDGADQKSLAHEIRFVLKGARELEITSSGAVVDRCPDHLKAWTTTTRSRIWGPAQDLSLKPASLSLDLLKRISVAVVEMPATLSEQIGQAQSGLVVANRDDLLALKREQIDPRIDHCPYDATPPGTDEAPPAEEPTQPAPAPAPVDPPF